MLVALSDVFVYNVSGRHHQNQEQQQSLFTHTNVMFFFFIGIAHCVRMTHRR